MWIKNMLAKLAPSVTEKPIVKIKTSGQGERKIQTVDVFKSEPWLKAPAELVIKELTIPWGCSQEKIDEAKSVALQAVFSGVNSRLSV